MPTRLLELFVPRHSTDSCTPKGTQNDFVYFCALETHSNRTVLTPILEVEILVNDQGHRITPSYVAFTDDERLVGDAAKNQAAANPKRTIFDVK